MEEGESFCRICLEGGSFLRPLKVPCHCTGSMAYIHPECLSTWRNQFPKTHEKHVKCTVCRTPYRWKERRKLNYWIVVSVISSGGTSVAYYYMMLRCLPNIRGSMIIYYHRPFMNPACVVQASIGALSAFFKVWSFLIISNPKTRIFTTTCLSIGAWIPTMVIYSLIFMLDLTKLVLPILFGIFLLLEWLCAIAYVLEK